MAWVQVNDGMWADVDSEGNASNWSTTDPTNKWWETAQRVPIPGSYQGGVVNPNTGKVEPFVATQNGLMVKSEADKAGLQGSEVRLPDYKPGFLDKLPDYLLAGGAAAFGGLAGANLLGLGGVGALSGGADALQTSALLGTGGPVAAGSSVPGLGLDAALTSGFNSGVTAGNAGGITLAGPTEAAAGTLPSNALNTFGQAATEGAGAGTAGGFDLGSAALPGAGVAGAAALGSGGYSFSPADLGQINPGTAAPWQNLMTPDPSNILNINNPINLGSSSPSFQLPSPSIPIPGAASDSAQYGTADAPAGAIPGGAPATPGAAAGTALSRLLNGTATADDLASLGGKVAPALLGAYASNQQSGQLADLAKQQMGFGEPSRGRYEASYAPGFSLAQADPGYADAVNYENKSQLSALSAKDGNPFGSPGGLVQAQQNVLAKVGLPQLNAYRNQNANTGGLGALASAAPQTAAAAIGSNANIYNSIGAGISDVTNPQTDLSAILKQLAGKSTSAYGLA